MVEADGLKVNGKYLLGKTDVVLESGTSLLLGSPNDVKALYKMIPGSKLHNESWYECTFVTLLDASPQVDG